MKTSFVPPKKTPKPTAKPSCTVNTKGSGSLEADKAREAVRRNPEAAANLLRAWMKGEME